MGSGGGLLVDGGSLTLTSSTIADKKAALNGGGIELETTTASAIRNTTIDPQLFQPAIGPHNFLTVEGADVPEHKRLSFGLMLNYQQNPYTIFTESAGGSTATHVVANQVASELDGAIGLFDRFQVGIGIPFTFYLDGDEVNGMGMPANLHLRETGIGDLRLQGKAHLATRGDEDQTISVCRPGSRCRPATRAGAPTWVTRQ